MTEGPVAPARRAPLVGRDRELARIAAARVSPVSAGIVLVGDAGVGKSRLASAALAAAAEDGAHVEKVSATRSAATVPLAAFAKLVPPGEPDDDGVTLMRRSVEALRERAGRRPIVLGVDDAHLLDPASAALVLHLVGSLNLFALATVRAHQPVADAVAALWKDHGAEQIELGRLAEDEVRGLMRGVLGAPAEEAAVRWVDQTSRGNPLYVHELVRGAVDGGALTEDDGFWRLTGPPSASRSLVDLVAEALSGQPPESRELVELLALGEPLTIPELAGLTTDAALLAAEARGLLMLDGEEVRLGHPLYGEVMRLSLAPLRARLLRMRLVGVLEARGSSAGSDALRIARLRLDAGGALPAELALGAAQAANAAGDPDLAAVLATQAEADAGLDAALVLAHAHAMRNRHADAEATLAAAEPSAPHHPSASRYLRLRLDTLHGGLGRTDDALRLIDRAEAWSIDPGWPGMLARMRKGYTTIREGFGSPDAFAQPLADPSLTPSARRSLSALHVIALLSGGRGDEAAEIAYARRPELPLRDAADGALLAAIAIVIPESCHRWTETESYLAGVVRNGVAQHAHDAVGLAALALARIFFLRGRIRDARRWLAETDVHLKRHDPYNATAAARALAVGLAAASDDLDQTTAALGELHRWIAGHPPLAPQRPVIRRAEASAEATRNRRAAGRRLLDDLALFDAAPGFAAGLAYDALRYGAPAAPALTALATRCQSRVIAAYAAHARARVDHSGARLLAVAEELAEIGVLRYAVEAASEAAAAFLAAGREDSARRAAARAREWHAEDQGGALPAIDGLDGVATELTPREAQLVALAAQGLSNAEIADRLVISVRTVETHLYRAMQKLGVRDRRELYPSRL